MTFEARYTGFPFDGSRRFPEGTFGPTTRKQADSSTSTGKNTGSNGTSANNSQNSTASDPNIDPEVTDTTVTNNFYGFGIQFTHTNNVSVYYEDPLAAAPRQE